MKRSPSSKKRSFDSFVQALERNMGQERIFTSSEVCERYHTDWTKFSGQADIVALPTETDEVAEILKICNDWEIPVIPAGGRTGLAGGAVPQAEQLVLGLEKIAQIGAVDPLSRTIRTQAGAITENVHHVSAKEGLQWPIDLASKGSCQIGGNLATNAGGLRVVRYGMARRWVLGLKAVLMSGEIIESNPTLEKDNTDLNWMQLLIGSEGYLAVITEATLKLTSLVDATKKRVLFFALDSLKDVQELFAMTRKGPFELTAFEFFSEKCLKNVEDKLGRKIRLQKRGGFYVLIELEEKSGLESWLQGVFSLKGMVDGTLAESSEDQRLVWGLREGITESISHLGPVYKYDVSVPVSSMVDFLEEIQERVTAYPLDLFLFGHFGDGSPHLNLVKPTELSEKEYRKVLEKFEIELFQVLKNFGGSPSAEHGVGTQKLSWLAFRMSRSELALYRRIKDAFDPKGLLNPGKKIL